MDSITASDLIDEVIYLANIDGQVTADGRHNPTRLYALMNRTIVSLRSFVSSLGFTYFLDETTVTDLPAQTAGEEFITIPYPDGAYEVHGVDIQRGSSWFDLTPIDFAARRDVIRTVSDASYGWWSIKRWPRENGSSAPTAGEIAVFPPCLSGPYKVWYVKPWVPILSTNGTFLILLQPDWLKWILNEMLMNVVQRDNNKNGTYQVALNAKAEATLAINKASKRIQRAGPTIPRRMDGLAL